MSRHRRAAARVSTGPLLDQFRAVPAVTPTPAEDAIRAAAAEWFHAAFLDAAPDDRLAAQLTCFADIVLPLPFHRDVLTRRVRLVRYALNHLARGHDPLAVRLGRCVSPGGIYHTPGLGPTLWAALAQSLDPDRHPRWCPAVEAGLTRLGLIRPDGGDAAGRFAQTLAAYGPLLSANPDLTAPALDDFLARVGRMTGRELPADPTPAADLTWGTDPEPVRNALRAVRTRTPLRKRLREATADHTAALAEFHATARDGDGAAAWAAYRALAPDPGWEHALARLDDAFSPALPAADRGRLWADTAAYLREHVRVHPLELADVVAAVTDPAEPPAPVAFGGFCADTFRFLGELAEARSKAWMDDRRDRYQFVLRDPLVELCAALAARYVRPVLGGEYGWELEADARPGRALTSICKNDFGRGGPYQPVQWVTFYRKDRGTRRADAQFFVRVAADGVGFGFHLGRSAREAGRQFRTNVQTDAEALYAALAAGGVFDTCRFRAGEDLATDVPVRSAADLRTWAAQKTLAAGRWLPAAAPELRDDDLVGEILLTFDRLVPAFACAAEADPRPVLSRRAGDPARPPAYDRTTFADQTLLPEPWLDRVFHLLRLKKQLILEGVPGTGKTHVARCLARLLARDNPEAVRLVQFHPGYSYEEFVEGVRVRSVETDGRTEVTYPVEDGVLAAFATRAAARPAEPHVLLIDEINRGNLPRVFGELLYLLEYRDQAVTLPYSKRLFRLPENLYVVATMNAADRSAAALDQALRRRFSFVAMPPDANLLAAWLDRHPPADADEAFGPRVVRVFEELNRRLARDLGPDKQVGHSFFMVPALDEGTLAAVWDHHVRPLLVDYLGGRTERVGEYEPAKLLGKRTRTPAG
ncbi:MAG TPA: AAA family ATPase [Urbifossiella sp.]|nr:AAA family ATPase [Urbifossiella sp.]